MTIRNPVEWGVDQARHLADAVGSTAADVQRAEALPQGTLPVVSRISIDDLREVLAKGYADFAANRTDVILLCVFYPVVGLILGRFASGEETLPLLFPLISGFALIGPIAAVGLYEMSRRRELGVSKGWADAFAVLQSHSFGPILLLGLILGLIFVLWLIAAQGIYNLTLGAGHTASIGGFIHEVFTTHAGHQLIVIGMGVGFLFALLVLTIGVVSVPMLIHRDVGVNVAVRTSVRAVTTNPGVMAMWGLIVAAALVIGSIPLFVGLVVVLPVLGHSTWHLYRKLVPR
jgi:uncharacterized membrane protein